MSCIAKLLSFARAIVNEVNVNDVTVDLGGGDNVTAQHFDSPGNDSYPLTNDYVLVVEVPRSGGKVAVGYVDPVNGHTANKGDKRIYARDPADGSQVCEVWLKNDGTITVNNNNGSFVLSPDGSQVGSNGSGSYQLQAGGDFVVNGVTIAANGDVTVPNSLVLNGKEIDAHTHPQGPDSAGDSQANTGGNI